MKNNINISASRSLKYNGIFELTVDCYKNKNKIYYTFDRVLFDSYTTVVTNNTTVLLTYEYVITEVANEYNMNSNEYMTLYLYFINDGKIDFDTKLNLKLPNYIDSIKYYIKKIIRKIKRCTGTYKMKVKNINLGTTTLIY